METVTQKPLLILDRSIGKTHHLGIVSSVLNALLLAQPPKGAVDYLLDCSENSLAVLPEEVIKSSIPEPKKEEENPKRRYRYYADDEEDRSTLVYSQLAT